MTRSTLILLLVLTVLELGMHVQLLTGVTALYQRDLFLLYYPLVETMLKTLSEGSWPLRDPSSAFGQPLLGNPDAQALYPGGALYLFLPVHLAYAWIVSAHSVFGALGVGLLSRRLSANRGAAGLVGGVAWIVCGPLHSLGNLWHQLTAAAWLPWVLISLERLLERRDRKSALLLGCALGLQILTGSADVCAMTMVLLLLRVLVGRRLGLWREVTISLLVAVLLGAGVWLPVAEIAANSGRTSLPESLRTYWSLHPLSGLEFVLPIPLSALPLKPEWRLRLFDGGEPFLRSVFMGVCLLPLGLAALSDARISRTLRAALFLAIAGGFLVALGRHTAAYGWITTAIPPFQIFRYPSKAVVPTAALICVLAGAGATSVVGSLRAKRVALLSAGALGLFALLLLGTPMLGAFETLLLDPARPDAIARVDHLLRVDLLMAVGLMTLLAAYVIRPAGVTGLVLGVMLLGVHVYQGVTLNEDSDWTISPGLLSHRPEGLELVRPQAGGRVFSYDYVHFAGLAERKLGRADPLMVQGLDAISPGGRRVIATRAAFFPMVGADWGLEYAWDADLRRIFDRRLAALVLDLRRVEDTPAFVRLLQISGVERVLALHDSGLEDLRELARLRTFLPEPLRVFGVPNPVPRVFMVAGRKRGTGHDLDDLTAADFDPSRTVLVDEGPVRPEAQSFSGSARVLERRADRLLIETSSNAPAFLVALEGMLPGWRAWVDGTPATVERANALFIGTETPSGRHRVEFRFLPASALIGVLLTFLTALSLGVFFLTHRQATSRT